MRPAALLVTLRRYTTVASILEEIALADWPGVDVHAELAGSFAEIPELLRSDVDLVALDGHGSPYGYLATSWHKPHLNQLYSTDYLRAADGTGIRSPIVVHAFCYGGRTPFRDALKGAIDRPNAAFLGSENETDFKDAWAIYQSVFRELASLGAAPDPAIAQARLTAAAVGTGAGWRADLLTRRRTGHSACRSQQLLGGISRENRPTLRQEALRGQREDRLGDCARRRSPP